MSFPGLLDHIVHIERDVETATKDDYGQPIVEHQIGENFAAALQQRKAYEVALISQAGADIGSWVIYTLPRLVDTADKIIHDSSACPKAEGRDLPDATYEVTGVRNESGRGHHLAIDAKLVGAAVAGVAGS